MKIDKDVPIPPPAIGRGRPISPAGKLMRELKVSESVLCTREEEVDCLRRIANSLKIKTVQRKTREGWRIWRTE